jgi:hypothetical protein
VIIVRSEFERRERINACCVEHLFIRHPAARGVDLPLPQRRAVPVRFVEVRLFRKGPLFGRRPVYMRRWEPGSALAATAKEISKYLADNGSVDATIVASWDEI